MNEENPAQNARARIALVEDDDSIRELITLNLQNEGFGVDSFFSAEQLDRKGDVQNYDLLLLDIMLPGMNGLNFAQKLREEEKHIPVLFISALGQDEKIKTAYESGAIDYIVKPFEIEHLLMKIKNLLYHFVKRHEAPLPEKLGEASIDWDLMQVIKNGKNQTLTPKEAEVLTYFLQNPNKVVSRDELIKNVWGGDVYVTSRNIDNFLVKFRKWFETEPSHPSIFITYPKKGYAYRTQ